MGDFPVLQPVEIPNDIDVGLLHDDFFHRPQQQIKQYLPITTDNGPLWDCSASQILLTYARCYFKRRRRPIDYPSLPALLSAGSSN